MSAYYYHQSDAQAALQSAAKAIDSALANAGRPHLFASAIWETNFALRKLSLAQMKLIQADSEYKAKDK
jgi:hypothetical protein